MFFTRLRVVIALTVALISGIIYSGPSATAPPNFVTGKNNTALFVVLDLDGLSNVHLATAQSLLHNHPNIEIHFASFDKIKQRLSRLSSLAQKRQPRAKDIVYNALTASKSYVAAMEDFNLDGEDSDGVMAIICPPGLEGIQRLAKNIQTYLSPWKAEDHFAIYQEIGSLIDEIDPAVTVLDTLFHPAIEVTRMHKRLHAFITPNMLVDNFKAEQPHGKMLWKYPALGSGFPFPVPWSYIPINILLNFKLMFAVMRMPVMAAKKTYLSEKGISNPIQFFGLHRSYTPWITQTTPGASIPLDFVPANVTCTGPLTLLAAPTADQDPELAKWVEKKPTLLVNLGSVNRWSIPMTKAVVNALLKVIDKTDVQVLWKYLPPNVPSEWQGIMEPLIATGRVRVSKWLAVDPAALLQTGHITAYVTHGGAGGFHESIEAGVPQIVLPLWMDHYDYASLAESIGIGVWGCREMSPLLHADCLSTAILRIVNSGPESLTI